QPEAVPPAAQRLQHRQEALSGNGEAHLYAVRQERFRKRLATIHTPLPHAARGPTIHEAAEPAEMLFTEAGCGDFGRCVMDDRPDAIPTVQEDNERVRVTEWRFAPGAHTGWHIHEY